jgi:hypothetical protein
MISKKYSLLNDKDWLYKKYVVEELSAKQIAKLIGSAFGTVIRALRLHGISVRACLDSFRIRSKKGYGCRKYPLLNDKDWLQQKYEVEKCSTNVITELVGAKTANSVRQALIRNGIEVRCISDGLTCNRKDDGFILNEEVITGTLLGDAMMNIWNEKSEKSYPKFRKRNKFYDHVLCVANILCGIAGKERIKEEWHNTNGKWHQCFCFSTLSHKELKPYFNKWYPENNNFIKLVPRDIILTPTVLLHWFLDDGSAYWRRKESVIKQVVITMCSESFSKEDQEWLCNKMREKFNLKCRVKPYSDGTGWRIEFPQSQAKLFYEIIGPSPVASLAYKWKL